MNDFHSGMEVWNNEEKMNASVEKGYFWRQIFGVEILYDGSERYEMAFKLCDLNVCWDVFAKLV